MPGEGGGEGRLGGMEGSGEGGTVALGWVLVSFWRRQEGEMKVCKGLQELHFRQGGGEGDWSMWDPLALLTGHVWSLRNHSSFHEVVKLIN